MLGGNLGSLLYGDVSVMVRPNAQCEDYISDFITAESIWKYLDFHWCIVAVHPYKMAARSFESMCH